MKKNNSAENINNSNSEGGIIFRNYENCGFVVFVPEGKTKEDEIIFTMVNQRLKELRTENGLTQAEVAKILKISQREYWRYEQEGYNVNILKLGLLAMFYNISLDWISGFHEERKPFFANHQNTTINGYILKEIKEAKKRGEKYTPHSFEENN